jgi:pimeloyl-ACP methyl ester carboxylesterase
MTPRPNSGLWGPRWVRSCVAVAVLAACHPAITLDARPFTITAGDYSYPLADPYAATVVGTPVQDAVNLPREVPVEELELTIFEDRWIPEIFWYEDKFRYSLAAQPNAAPLIFIIGGNNAGHTSRFSRFLQKLFYTAGFHAVSISSPTYPNFIATASTTRVPGRTGQDAADLYRAMRLARKKLEKRLDITDVSLAGYSLGAWQSAFVARLDDEQQSLNFRKVLLINPPVSLYRSSGVLDGMLTDNLPGGVENVGKFLDQMLRKFTQVYQRSASVDFSQDFLFRAFLETQPSDRDLKALVGLSFRLSAANIAFTADVMNRIGYIVPSDATLTVSTSLTPYFDRAMHRGFKDYFDNVLYPFYKALDPSLTREEMIAESSLESIEPYLRRADKIGLVTNADDIILASGDIQFLERTFGDRAHIFPTGGHCGNMQDTALAAAMLQVLRQ